MTLTNLIQNKIDHLWFRLILSSIPPAKLLADIGSGNRPQQYIKAEKMYAIDPCETLPCKCDPGIVHVRSTWCDIRPALCGFDCATLFDVIEHLEKEDAKLLLDETARVVKVVVVFTPFGFMPQEDGEWNTHRSGWYPEDFGDGWQVEVFTHFHWCDFKGRALDPPHGAILAIYGAKV